MRWTRVFGGLLLAVMIILSGGFADADEYVVSQKSRKFSPKLLQAKVGDSLVFLNDDRFAHNLYSDTEGHEFNIRKQLPGDRDILELLTAGVFVVECAIHPRMKMQIVVE